MQATTTIVSLLYCMTNNLVLIQGLHADDMITSPILDDYRPFDMRPTQLEDVIYTITMSRLGYSA